jgi:ADP-ribose pyrophosphatase
MRDEVVELGAGDWIRLCRRGRWEYVERVRGAHGAVIIALTPERELLVVEQHRIPLGAPTLELPAGLVGDEDPEESPDLAAHRELEEETGYRAIAVEEVASGCVSPGMTNETMTIFRATGVSQVGPGGGVEGESIRVHRVPLTELRPWLEARRAEGTIVDLKLYFALAFADAPSRPTKAS